MAFYIELTKTSNEQDYVYYDYEFSFVAEVVRNEKGKLRGKSKLVKGKVRICKKTGGVEILELAEGDNGMHAQRASWALMKHWKKGEFPDKTCWAS